MIVDASNQVMGRISSRVAKKLLEGEEVKIINSEKIIVTGDPEVIMTEFRNRITRGDPHHGPFYPRRPDMIMKRSIRGMIPYKKSKGRDAMRRLKVFVGNPDNEEGERIEKDVTQINCKFLTLEQISKKLRGLA